MLVIQRPTVEAVDEEEGNRQRFAISPLEPGFGHTLGNSLRRTLLSSIPGAAITEVRFDDALHEFDTIAGVTEDVTDIILNLKDVVITSESDDFVTLRLDVRGPAEVAAADIQTTADVEILNPGLHIATLNDKARLAVDLTIGRGKGYLSAAGRTTATIGVIPIDAIFSPVRRVTFSVEPTRVEQSTNYDRLVLDIETDGSVTPRDVLASAGATLQALVELVAQMTEEPEGLDAHRGPHRGGHLARPRARHRGARPLRAPAQLPQAGAGEHGRRTAPEDRGRPAGHHELRPEVPRRSHREARRAGSVAPRSRLNTNQEVDPCQLPRNAADGSAARASTSA